MVIKKSFQNILKKRVFKIESKRLLPDQINLLLHRLFVYLSLYTLLILLSIFIFPILGLYSNDVNSARYMLSALIQSEAAIIAIVITLSLVVLQLAAQSYSTRVIDVFKKTPDFWILIGIYLIAMIYELGVLKKIEEIKPGLDNLSNLDNQITYSYFLGIYVLLALIPYIWNTLNLLKPSTVIGKLSEKITKQNILSAIEEQETHGDKDPIQPVIDIVRSSLMKYDFETVRDGLKTIGDHSSDIFKNEVFEKEEEIRLSKIVFTHLKRIGKLAISKEDEDSTLEVIVNMNKIGETALNQELKHTTMNAVVFLGTIGEMATERKLKEASMSAEYFIGNIGKTAAEKGFEHATTMAAVSLGHIGESMVLQKFDDILRVLIYDLGAIGRIAAEQELIRGTITAAVFLENVGKAMAENKIEHSPIAECFKEIAQAAAENKLEQPTGIIITSLGEVGKAMAEQKLESTAYKITESLEEIGKVVFNEKLEGSIEIIQKNRNEIQKIAKEQGINLEEHKSEKVIEDILKKN